MDKFEQLSTAASYAVAIFGNQAQGDFALFDLTKGTTFPVENIQREIAERSLVFCGVMGVVQGIPCTTLAEPLDSCTIRALSHAFNERVESASAAALTAALERQPKDDSEQWLWRLWSLKDTRPEMRPA
jgi:hypothetical protein